MRPCHSTINTNHALPIVTPFRACGVAGCSAGLKVDCGDNTFQPNISQISAGACQQCPADAVSPEASTSIEDCKCRAGYYDSGVEITSVTCKPCFAGSMCGIAIGTTIKTLPLRECYYRALSTSDDLRRCPDCDHSSGCVGGVGEGEGPCKDWLVGPYCQLCNVSDRSRYYDTEQSECVVCKVDAVAPLLRGCGLTLLAVVIVLLFTRFKPYRRVPLLARLARWLTRLFVQLSLRSKAKQLLGFYQIATRIGDVYKVGFLLCANCADCAYCATVPTTASCLLCLLSAYYAYHAGHAYYAIYNYCCLTQGSDAGGGGAAAVVLRGEHPV